MAAIEERSRAARAASAIARAATVLGLAGVGCGGVRAAAVRDEPVAVDDRIGIVAAERGPNGPRLIAIDDHGDREFALIAPATGRFVRDTHPAISPTGQWVVFASNRERAGGEGTSLWIAPVGPDAVPVRLTDGPSIEAHPSWDPEGGSIVFASTRARGDFDLWRLRIRAGRAVGPPEALTSSADQEVTPVVAPDGTIYFAVVTTLEDRSVSSRLARRAVDGSVELLTEGPADTTPAVSPDGTTLAFARPVVGSAGPSAELWTMPIGGGAAIPTTALPLTDESGPVWSRDGALLLATSVLRGEAGVLLSSVVFVEVGAPEPVTRLLRDRAGVIARLTPAVATAPLDLAALRANPAYLPELARIMSTAIEQHREAEPTGHRGEAGPP